MQPPQKERSLLWLLLAVRVTDEPKGTKGADNLTTTLVPVEALVLVSVLERSGSEGAFRSGRLEQPDMHSESATAAIRMIHFIFGSVTK